MIFIIAAPSGAGKSSLVTALLAEERNLTLSVSYTTRAPRSGEAHGKDYFFITRDEFAQMCEQGEFLEHAEVYGNFYGTSRSTVQRAIADGKDVVMEIDWQGARQVRRAFTQAISVFVLPPSLQVLKHRLETRGKDSAEVILRRLAAAREDVTHADEFDYIIVNKDFPEAVRDLTSVVRAERLRRERQRERHREIFAQLLKDQ